MIENLRISLRGIWSHKLRSLLTMLGIIIGIAAIISIVSTIEGTNEQIKRNLVGSGTNAVAIIATLDGNSLEYGIDNLPVGTPMLDEDVKQELTGIDGATRASFYRKLNYAPDVYFLNTSLDSTAIAGIDEDYLETAGLSIIAGRGIAAHDMSGQRICLIDKSVLRAAFNGVNPLGKTIDIAGEPFVVAGVVAPTSNFEPTIETISDYYMYANTGGGVIYIPNTLWPTISKYDVPMSALVRAASTDDMGRVGKKAADLLNKKVGANTQATPKEKDEKNGSGGGLSYQAVDVTEQTRKLQQLASSTNAMLIGVASISLIVGGIGVMNIMLVSVTERTREIGLKKALGARRRTILIQFLTEAVMLSGIGGLFGVIVGFILSHVISALAGLPVVISAPAVLVAVAFSMVVGVVFGIMPSMKAARLNPIDALRYE
ncbi:ABC transporter permease [Atopobium sp. oral taxon 810]|uniref:ABC transporter permease n=1 Tax=Atopobium sp. oral taxon 810 TaxID=712158 RepID=UPI0003964C5D|nr:ABC transporter permease [Atopobium sp. oral taxon 810]ERI04334.1 efflux ABC transporter, permease protein [Atopobium sp. oral taxon 810 str. F0209]